MIDSQSVKTAEAGGPISVPPAWRTAYPLPGGASASCSAHWVRHAHASHALARDDEVSEAERACLSA